jgi:hypothetical protein
VDTIELHSNTVVERVTSLALALVPSPPSLVSNNCPAVIDTGCSATYITCTTPHIHREVAYPSVKVTLPNGETMQSSHTAQLQLHPSLPDIACRAHIFLSLTCSLISVGQLCDSGCTATFTANGVAIAYQGKTTITGDRSPTNNLWCINLAAPLAVNDNTESVLHDQIEKPLSCNTVARTYHAADRIAFLHASCNYPVISTWLKEIESGFFTTFPGLTADLVRKYPPHSETTFRGHMDQERSNQRSTKPKKSADEWTTIKKPESKPTTSATTTSEDLAFFEDSHPTVASPPAVRTHAIYVSSQPVTGKIYSDAAGRFGVPSSKGNEYLLIVYDYDSNYIFAEPMKSRTGAEHLAAYKRVHTNRCLSGTKIAMLRHGLSRSGERAWSLGRCGHVGI